MYMSRLLLWHAATKKSVFKSKEFSQFCYSLDLFFARTLQPGGVVLLAADDAAAAKTTEEGGVPAHEVRGDPSIQLSICTAQQKLQVLFREDNKIINPKFRCSPTYSHMFLFRSPPCCDSRMQLRRLQPKPTQKHHFCFSTFYFCATFAPCDYINSSHYF